MRSRALRLSNFSQKELGAFWHKLDEQGARTTTFAATLLREHRVGRDVVKLLLAHSEKSAAVAAHSHVALAADRKRALQYLTEHVEALAAGLDAIPLRAA